MQKDIKERFTNIFPAVDFRSIFNVSKCFHEKESAHKLGDDTCLYIQTNRPISCPTKSQSELCTSHCIPENMKSKSDIQKIASKILKIFQVSFGF